MSPFSRFSLVVLLVLAVRVSAQPPSASECLQALSESAPCPSEAHPDTRRIFRCPFRGERLQALGIDRAALPALFDGLTEHEMVRRAIDTVVGAKALPASDRAVLWEELAAIAERRLGYPISRSFRAQRGESTEDFIFQGTKRFEGQVYVLVILADGRSFTGKVDPIDDIDGWTARLSDLRPIE